MAGLASPAARSQRRVNDLDAASTRAMPSIHRRRVRPDRTSRRQSSPSPTFNPGAIPVAVLAIMLAVFEWRGRRWIIRTNDERRGHQRSNLHRRWLERILQLFSVLTVVASIWVLTYDFGSCVLWPRPRAVMSAGSKQRRRTPVPARRHLRELSEVNYASLTIEAARALLSVAPLTRPTVHVVRLPGSF